MKKLLILAISLMMLTSCATIVKGSKQEVKIHSESGKVIKVYDKYGNLYAKGVKELVLKLPKSSGYNYGTGAMANTYTVETDNEKKILLPYQNLAYTLGNAFTFGIGYLVDEITGAKYTLRYNDVEVDVLNFK